MTYEILAVEEVGDEQIKLVRKGWRFRLVSSPRERLLAVAQSIRRELRSREVAWRAFDFAVASERYWQAEPCRSGRDEARAAMLRAGRALRAAAIKQDDPPAMSGPARAVLDGLPYRRTGVDLTERSD